MNPSSSAKNDNQVQKKKSHTCNICNVSCSTSQECVTHNASQGHKFLLGVKRTQLSSTEQHKTLDEKIKAYGKKEPLIGVEYIYEYAEDKSGFPMYECKLCDRVIRHDVIFCHVVGIRHRILYLEKHHPIMGIDTGYQVKSSADYRRLQNNALAIEQTHGRKQKQVVDTVFLWKSDGRQLEDLESVTAGLPEEKDESDKPTLPSGKSKAQSKKRAVSPASQREKGGRSKLQRDGGDDSAFKRNRGDGPPFQHDFGGGPPYQGDFEDGPPFQHVGGHTDIDIRLLDREGNPTFQRHGRGGPMLPGDFCDVDIRLLKQERRQYDSGVDPLFQGGYDDVDIRSMNRSVPSRRRRRSPDFQGDLDLRSRVRPGGFQDDCGDVDVRSMMRAGGISFRELKAAHEANLRGEHFSKSFPGHGKGDKEKDCDSDMEVRSMEFSDCDPEEFWCNEELFDFLRNYSISEDEDIQFVMKVSEMCSNALVRHKKRTEDLKRRILDEKQKLEEEKRAFLELKHRKERVKSPPASASKDQAAAAATTTTGTVKHPAVNINQPPGSQANQKGPMPEPRPSGPAMIRPQCAKPSNTAAPVLPPPFMAILFGTIRAQVAVNAIQARLANQKGTMPGPRPMVGPTMMRPQGVNINQPRMPGPLVNQKGPMPEPRPYLGPTMIRPQDPTSPFNQPQQFPGPQLNQGSFNEPRPPFVPGAVRSGDMQYNQNQQFPDAQFDNRGQFNDPRASFGPGVDRSLGGHIPPRIQL